MDEKPKSVMSSPTSIWLRAIRYLTHEGKTLPPFTSVMVKSSTDLLLPFAVMTQTERNRLICWPVLPKDFPLETPKGRLIDHITLELSNGRTHTTAFGPNGKRHHKSTRGKIKEIPGTGLAPWFTVLVQWSVIENQDLRVETNMFTPAGDGPRRESVFRKMAEQYRGAFIALPDGPGLGDYIYTMFCLQMSETVDLAPLGTEYFGDRVDDRIDGFPDGTIFPIVPTKLQIGTTKLIALTSAPPGIVKTELSYGFVSAKTVRKRADHCRVVPPPNPGA